MHRTHDVVVGNNDPDTQVDAAVVRQGTHQGVQEATLLHQTDGGCTVVTLVVRVDDCGQYRVAEVGGCQDIVARLV